MNPQECPELFELEELARGRLDEESASRHSSHAYECESCAARLEQVRENLALEERLGRAWSSTGERRSPLPDVDGFRILREIGRGGMGVVYEAEQLVPPRRVALKVVRGSQYVDGTTLRLFQREIRVLARLAHANIAALHDAGSTSGGEHWFAMELVQGEPLSRACSRLDREEKLELFLEVCSAIDYAHQRGVVHRDLKPSNVLVDGTRRAKVLDFGLAKITDQDVSQTSLVTEVGAIRGTLAYMSPEQARGDPAFVDLRSDVYSLGAMLYELLTGRLPTDVSGVPLAEAARRICEEPPPRPSSVDASLRGDLETIALVALEKDPGRRYSSAAALAEDVRRHLADEPILARAPSGWYQFRKLVARHKLASALLTAIFVLSLGTAIWTSALYARESDLRKSAETKEREANDAREAESNARIAAQLAEGRAEEHAREAAREAERARKEAKTHERVRDFLLDLFEAADPERKDQGEVTARDLLDRSARGLDALVDEPEVHAALSLAMGSAYLHLGQFDSARPLLEKAAEVRRAIPGLDPLLVAEALNQLGALHSLADEFAAARRLHEEALSICERAEPNGGLRTAAALAFRAHVERFGGDMLAAERTIREALAMREAHGDFDSESYINAKQSLSMILHQQRRDAEAEALAQDVVDRRRAKNGRSLRLAVAVSNLGLTKLARGNGAEGEPLLREAFDLKREMLGEESRGIAGAHSNLAWALDVAGKLDEALEHYRAAIAICKANPGALRSLEATAHKNLGKLHIQRKEYDEAHAACLTAAEMRLALAPNDTPALADCWDNLGQVEYMRRNYAKAEEWFAKALDVYEGRFGPENLRTGMVRANLGVAILYQGRTDDGESTLLDAFRVLEMHKASNAVAYRSAARWLAQLYEQLGKKEEAERYAAIRDGKVP